jgi:hypothetical protein
MTLNKIHKHGVGDTIDRALSLLDDDDDDEEPSTRRDVFFPDETIGRFYDQLRPMKTKKGGSIYGFASAAKSLPPPCPKRKGSIEPSY